MKLPVSSKVATFEKKPRIEKGYYLGTLVEVKERKREDGVWVECPYGRQIILMFEVFDKKTKQAVMLKKDNEEKVMRIPSVVYHQYKDKDGSYRTAVTPNARITKIFQTLGWKFNADEELDVDSFVGKHCELNIDDYEAEFTKEDGTTEKYKASAIKDINALEDDEVKSSSSNDLAESVKDNKEERKKVRAKIEEAHRGFENKTITEDGYALLLSDLRDRELMLI